MKQQQNGNVLFIILAAVGLLAILTLSLANSEHAAESVDAETMAIELQDMYDFAIELERGVSRALLGNGCQIVEISFDHPNLQNYNTANYYLNPNSPADDSCDIFAPEGGGVVFQDPPEMAQAVGASEYGFLSAFSFEDIGTAGQELIVHALVPLAACLKINNDHDIVNTGGSPPVHSAVAVTLPYSTQRTFPYFVSGTEGFLGAGTFGSTYAPELYKHKTGCFEDSGGAYNFYHILYAR